LNATGALSVSLGMQNLRTHSSRSRLAALLVVVFALGLTLAACGGSSKSSGSADISMKNLQFTVAGPVASGATVTIKNNDTVTHTVTSDDGTSFNLTVNAGSSASFKAPTKAGIYKFHCNIHSQMHGVLTVQ